MRIEEQHALLERFQRHLANDTTDFARSSLRVPAEHYTDDAQTASEIEALFLRRPLLVAMSADLPKAGDYLCHDLLETPLILVRGPTRVRAFINAVVIAALESPKGEETPLALCAHITRGTTPWMGMFDRDPMRAAASTTRVTTLAGSLRSLATKFPASSLC